LVRKGKNMRRLTYLAAIPVAFAAGLFVSHSVTPAWSRAAAVKVNAQIIDLAAMTDAEIGPQVPNMGTLRSRLLVATPGGTISIQSGNVPKHYHVGSNEIQYVISGSGTFWLGNEQHQIHPGDLIIIPKGTVHAGNVATNGEFKVLSIKLPPQAPGDMHMVP
jgi:quercetin dioxygenase-like cupin family protein